jgi:flagellar basal body L-ring protein FlgH
LFLCFKTFADDKYKSDPALQANKIRGRINKGPEEHAREKKLKKLKAEKTAPAAIEEVKPMLTIDRFEGEYALIEMNRRIFHIPKVLLPKNAREGDVITIQISVDKEAVKQQKQSVDRLADKLFKD